MRPWTFWSFQSRRASHVDNGQPLGQLVQLTEERHRLIPVGNPVWRVYGFSIPSQLVDRGFAPARYDGFNPRGRGLPHTTPCGRSVLGPEAVWRRSAPAPATEGPTPSPGGGSEAADRKRGTPSGGRVRVTV